MDKPAVHKYHPLHNRTMLMVQAAIGLVLAYALASRAIDTGSYWQYFGALIVLALSIKLFIRAVRKQ
jgi:hypothetical protein